MKYNEFKEIMIDYVSGNLSEEKQKEFDRFLIENPIYKVEFEEFLLLWNHTEENIPEPTMAMDMNFYTMLQAEKEKATEKTIIDRIGLLVNQVLFKRVVYTLAILTVGFFLGREITEVKTTSEETIDLAEAKKETENLRSQLVLTLLEQPSANKRLKAVNEVNKMNEVTETIINALFKTLNNDESVNVRLSAIEALGNYTDIPQVREGLIASILKQESPLVQIALADVMVLLQEKKAIEPFEQLIEEEDTNESAKQKMEESIERII